ncbi:multidrug effflux MFS transporter [Reinekea sp.]|jgi:DHA1 family bicyclomycin/chloramphenicol resistance-like MFS transporter|uniref:multidrug effflux MFS transporter n=1 Tax=Reinekea sp. TaxID=1970455 RepID=UPI003989F5B3
MSIKPVKQPSLFEFILLIALLSSLVALSLDTMLPAFSIIAEDLAISDIRHTQWIITAIIVGMAFGQLFFGPLSDAYGRKGAILSGIVLFCVGALLSMFAQTFEALLIGRFIQGIGVSGPRIATMALVRDKFVGNAMARIMSFVMVAFVLIPMLAPLVGQAILMAFSWRAIFGLFVLLSIIAGIWLAIRQPETLVPENRRPMSLRSIFNGIKLVMSQPRTLGFSIASGVVFGGLLAYVGSAQAIFEGIYQLGDKFPFFFAALALGIGSASYVNGKLVMRMGALKLAIYALIGKISLASILVVLALTQDGSPALWQFMSLGFLLMFCVGILFGNLSSLAMVPLGKLAGVGAAVVGTTQNIVSVVISVAIGWFFNGTLLPIVSGFLVSAVIALLLVMLVRNKADDLIG